MSVIKACDFNVTGLKFSSVKKLETGQKLIFVNKDDAKGNKILLQTPKMNIPFGIKKWENKDNGSESFDISLSFHSSEDGNKNSKEISQFKTQLKKFDDFIISNIITNSKDWVNKSKVSKEVVEEALYNKSLKPSLDKEKNETDYAPTIKVKLDKEKDSERFLSILKIFLIFFVLSNFSFLLISISMLISTSLFFSLKFLLS